MISRKRLNQIGIKLLATVMLLITLFMYPVQSLAFGDYFRDNFLNKEQDNVPKPSPTTPSTPSPTTPPIAPTTPSTGADSTAWANPFEVPKGITSAFGWRGGFTDQNGVWHDPGGHHGTDFGAAAGTPILAPSSGTVVGSGWLGGYGYHLHVNRGDEYGWLVAHMSAASHLKVGDKVELGQIVGYVGSTGKSTGPHLHLEVRKDGVRINPETVIDFKSPGISRGMASSRPSNSLLIRDYKKMIQDGDFFYKGIPEGHYSKSSFNFWKWLVKLLAEIVDYLLGIATYIVKLGILGWGILVEVILTDAFDSLVVKNVGSGNYRKNNLGFFTDSKRTVNVENIFFNRVEVLNINFFESKESVKKRLLKYSPTGIEIDELYGTKRQAGTATEAELEAEEEAITEAIDQELEDGPLLVIKDYFAQIFLVFYAFGLLLLLSGLIINGIMSSIESVGSKKAAYKKRGKDWLKALIEATLVIAYMILILQIHTMVINILSALADASVETLGGNYIQTDMGRNYTIMETLRTRAYSFKFSVGFPATIMYLVLIWYTIRFFLMYVKRFLVIFLLSLLGPLLMIYDLIIKTIRGKSSVRLDWIKEYSFNVLIQIVHALIYLIFIPLAYSVASTSVIGFIIMFMVLKFLLSADKIVRQIFNIKGSRRHSTLENVLEKSSFSDYAQGFALASFLGRRSLPMQAVTKGAGRIMSPVKGAVGVAGAAVVRGGYNLSQTISERRAARDRAAGRTALDTMRGRREAKRNVRVEELLKLQGYSEKEIQEKMTPGGKHALSADEKDKIRLLKSSHILADRKLRRGLKHLKYTGRKFQRVLSNMGETDSQGRKRMKAGTFEYDYDTGRISLKGGLRDKFRDSVIKEFKLGKGSKGKAQYKQAVADIKQAIKAGGQVVAATILFPISFADPSIKTGLYVGLGKNLEFNSKVLKLRTKKEKPALVRVNPNTGKHEYKSKKQYRKTYNEAMKKRKAELKPKPEQKNLPT